MLVVGIVFRRVKLVIVVRIGNLSIGSSALVLFVPKGCDRKVAFEVLQLEEELLL